jgi:TolB protein
MPGDGVRERRGPGSSGRWWAGVVLVLGTFIGAHEACAQIRGTIFGPGTSSYPVAVSPLKDLGGRSGDGAERFAEILGRDLDLSGYFRVLDRSAYIDDPQRSATTADQIEFHNWSVIGALALVKGTLERSGDRIAVEVRLFDVVERRELAGKRYRSPAADLPRIAHKFADEILRVFTGEAGPFDSRIAFVSTRGGRSKELHVLTFDAESPTPLTSDRSIALSPSWSPDAREILFASYREGAPGFFVFDVASRRLARLARAGGLSAGGAWSPDGTLLAVAREVGGNPEIVLLRRDGQVERRLTDHPGIDVSPVWSPDGRQIAFCSDRTGGPQIFIVGADGRNARRVTFGGTYSTSPSWSPRGDRLAYTSRVGGRFHIFTVEPGGGRGEQLTSGGGDNEDPSWSPDGRYLVFSSTRTGHAQLFMTDRTGRLEKQLTRGSGDDSSPAWSARLEW